MRPMLITSCETACTRCFPSARRQTASHYRSQRRRKHSRENAVCSLHGHAVQRHRPTPIEDVGINFSPKVERNAQRPSPAQATVWSERRTEAGNRQKKFGIGKTCGNCRRFTGVCRANDPLPAHFQNFEPSPGRIVRASRSLAATYTAALRTTRPSNRSFSNAINPSHSASAIAARSRASPPRRA